MNFRKLFLIASAFVFLSSCAQLSSSKLYWGNYSNTLYNLKKNPNKATLVAHKSELQRIIEKSKELNILAPPGIQAELGFMYLNEGNKDLGIGLINSESETYPESKFFMSKIYQQVKTKRK
ncbi:MAG: hypothetical protein BM556_16810 [Bacteriovorax sp. MedPE-SWde]|nr:MAG: hypothetical protein BM556_16810 [Bacteriovorax sp. MedPE-SWde]